MADKKKVLFITQEMNPYIVASDIAKVARELPEYIQNNGMEIRVLMPRFGSINERRHRLHEVVRLSGINIIIDNDDFPLIIKVASLPGARMQVYFLDNEDFFKRKSVFRDDKDKFFEDNAERMIFFCKGALETVKKFGWPPDIIHCHGWMTSLIPLYIRTAYKNEPVFGNAKILYSVYKNSFEESLSQKFLEKAPITEAIEEKDLKPYSKLNNSGLNEGALEYSDGVILGSEEIDKDINKHIKKLGIPVLEYSNGEGYLENYKSFYENFLQD